MIDYYIQTISNLQTIRSQSTMEDPSKLPQHDPVTVAKNAALLSLKAGASGALAMSVQVKM